MAYFATGAALTAALNALPASLTGTYKAFDAFFYAEKYMGSYSGTLTPIEHFVQIGAARGHSPNADFNPVYYQSTYKDLAGLDAADMLYHYVRFGLNEGRAGNAELASKNWASYLDAYPAVKAYVQANLASFGGSLTNGAIAHYVKFGAQQGFTLPNAAGQTLKLTTGVDNLSGTANADIISAPAVQHQSGELVNTLETGDVINGGEGIDTLNAVLNNPSDTGNDFNGVAAISATLSGVEVVNYRAQYFTQDAVNFSIVDAELHTGVQQYWSDNSRADLQIEDVRQLPEVLTFGMRQTDPVNNAAGVGASDFSVYFDPAQLAADRATTGNSSLTLTLVDNTAGAKELENFPVNGVVFTLGGTTYTVQSDAMGKAATYAAFVTELKAALAKQPALANITVTQNANNSITLTDPAGATFGTVGYTWVGNIVPAGGQLQWNQAVGAAVVSEAAITTNVVLDAVGRTSQGGTLDIGSMADGGVEVFNVSVDRSSWLTSMESREDFGLGARHLETVNLTSIGAKGDLAVGNKVIGATGELDGRVQNGLTDVREVQNVAFTGNLSYGVNLTDDAIGRYLDNASGKVIFTYEGGAGNDNITIADNSNNDVLSDDADFAMNVILGAGNDRLNLDMANVDNVTVDGGAGANVIAVARSHGTTAGNTFKGFTGFQTYEVEGSAATQHDFTSMAAVTAVSIATVGAASTELRDLPAPAGVVITGKNQTLAGANNSNANQAFGAIAINGADATATDTSLRVTLQNTARLDGVLTVNQLSVGNIPATATTAADVNPIRTLELVSAGQRDTRNVVTDINAALVNTFNLSGTQDLAINITAAANSTAGAASRANLVVNGSDLTGDLDLTMAGALVTAVDSGTTSTVTLRGTAGTADTLRLTGALTTTNDTTVAGFERVQFAGAASGSFDASNVTGVTLFDINNLGGNLALVDLAGSARINVNIDADGNVADRALVFDAASSASGNSLILEFRDADNNGADNDVDFWSVGSTSVRDYGTITLDLGGYANQDEAYRFDLRMQDAQGDDEWDPAAPAANVDASNVYDADSVIARKVTVVGGGDQGAVGIAGGVDSVDLRYLTNVLSEIDVSAYVGRVALIFEVYSDAVVDRNVTFKLNGYGTTLAEIGSFDNIVTYSFTRDAVATTENVNITNFDAFGLAGVDVGNVSVLDLSAIGVKGLADLNIAAADLDLDGFEDTVITSNTGLNFEIELMGVAVTDLSVENFKFAV